MECAQRDPFLCYTEEDWVVEQEKDILYQFKQLIQSGAIDCVQDRSEIHEMLRLSQN